VVDEAEMADEREEDEDGGFGDLGGIGEHSGSLYPGEDGMGSIPHLLVEEEPHREDAPPPDERPPLDDDR
jgi:hypothetical protein